MSAVYRLVKYAVSAHEERDAAKAASIPPGFYGNFPSSLGLYYLGDGQDYKSLRFYLGTLDQPAEKLYALTYHEAYGFRQMTLYSTLEFKPPVLAIAANEKRVSGNGLLTLPPLAEGQGHTFDERLKYNLRNNTHSFSAMIDRRAETFEWREDKQLKPKIRRLVRFAGNEVETVALWREGSVPNRQGRLATFEFLGSGATGELGARWALMAVVSVLRVCQSHG